VPLSKEEILDSKISLALLDRLGLTTPTGKLKAMFGLGSECYVAPREREQLRFDMLAVQEDYYRRFHENLDHCRYAFPGNPGSRIIEITENPFMMVREKIGDWPKFRNYTNVLFKDYTHPDFPADAGTVTPWESDIFVASENRNRFSSHSCYLPVGNNQDGMNFDLLRECVLDWCIKIHPAHGQAGFCVILEVGSISGEPYAYPILQRYPGLNLIQSISFANETINIFNRIKSVNWLTILGDEILDELGGIDNAKKTLEPDCTIFDYPGGIVIQAGPAPQLGDTVQGFIPEPYRKVSHFTKPARFEGYHFSLFKVFKPLIAAEEANKWVSRFD